MRLRIECQLETVRRSHMDRPDNLLFLRPAINKTPIPTPNPNCGRKLNSAMISPAQEDVEYAVVKDHAAEPIKDMDDIIRVSRHLISQERYRDNMLFIVGINFGLRVGDLLSLRFSHLINDDLVFKDRFAILEHKTANTRKKKKNRYITINTAVTEAVILYLSNTPGISLSDFMFRSESKKDSDRNQPMHRNSVDRMLKGIAAELGLGNKMSTHTLRKTFAYHQMVMSGNDTRKLLLLQKMFGHSSSSQTLDYIGITSEEIDEAYKNFNLGSESHHYLIDSWVEEGPIAAIG